MADATQNHLEIALKHLNLQRAELDEAIARVEQLLGRVVEANGLAGGRRPGGDSSRKVMSPEARAKIAESQRARWAERKKNQTGAATSTAQAASDTKKRAAAAGKGRR